MATSITKTMETETAHRLQTHPGACCNIHGHTYKWEVTLKTTQLDFNGMVYDFKGLKAAMTKYINDLYDHTLVLEDDDPIVPLLVGKTIPGKKDPLRTYLMHMAPTAENMAFSVYTDIARAFPQFDVSVTVWETPTSKAVYTPTEEV